MTPEPEPEPDAEPGARVATPVDVDATDRPDSDLTWDIVDQWGADSFPASDPPANW
jgi:hypothetical protein